ncbi:MAG: hypothetical protein V3U76_16255 [Granulosicoccus sp.]
MKRSEFEHAVRAAGAILATDKLLIIGSQAIHGSVDEIFDEAERSIKVDIASLGENAEHNADVIDGSIGELSIFQSTFGYYAQGVTAATAMLPNGWRKRPVTITRQLANSVYASIELGQKISNGIGTISDAANHDNAARNYRPWRCDTTGGSRGTYSLR